MSLRPSGIAALLAAAVAAGCGSTSTGTVTRTATKPAASRPQAPIGGGSARCTGAEVAKAAAGAAGRPHPVVIDSICRDGWMAISLAADGPDAPPATYLFEAEGPFWALVNRTKACMPPSPVPEALQAVACAGSQPRR